MAVRLEATIKRFIGKSTDDKPTDGVPVGSSFLEEDKGRIYRYGSDGWTFYNPVDEQAELLNALLVEVASINNLLTLAIGVEIEESLGV